MRSIKSISLACMVLLAIYASPVFPAPSTPAQVVKDYMAAVQAEGMTAVPRFIHPEELRRFKEILMPMLRKDAAQKGDVIHGLFGVEATLSALEAMAPPDFMNGFMRIGGEQLKEVQIGDVDILGSVRENETEHVVARTGISINGVKIKSIMVVSVRRAGADWKLLLTSELEGMATALAAF